MSIYAGRAGTKFTLQHNGKTYHVNPLNDALLGEMEAAGYQHARNLLKADKDDLSHEEYVQRLDTLREAFARGEFSFHGARGRGYAQTSEGALKMLGLMLGITDRAEALEVAAGCLDELRSLSELAKAESLAAAPPGGPEGNP